MTKSETMRVQGLLSKAGLYRGAIDGLAGPMTMTGIRAWQRAKGLPEDGIAGIATLNSMFPATAQLGAMIYPERIYKGVAKALEAGDIAEVAASIEVQEAALRAVLAVESAGHGFDQYGRVTALYEPHVAYRLSSGDKRAALMARCLAYAKWGEQPYPKSHDLRFHQIDECAEIAGMEFAADATSWGLPQIMGFNAQSAGYNSSVEMVTAFAADEQNQLAALGAFILNNKALHRALQHLDWAGFAAGYNGGGFRRNAYDTKLADAYRRAKP